MLRRAPVAVRDEGRRGHHWRASVRVTVAAIAVRVGIACAVRIRTAIRVRRIRVTIVHIAVVRIALIRITIVGVAITGVPVGITVISIPVSIAVIRVVAVICIPASRILIRLLYILVLRGRRSFVCVLVLLRKLLFGGRSGDGTLALFGSRAADDDGDGLTNFDDGSGLRFLAQNRIRLGIRAVARSPAPHVETLVVERRFALHHILADDVRHFHFRAAQAQVNRAHQSDEKSGCDGDDNAKLANGRKRTLCQTQRS